MDGRPVHTVEGRPEALPRTPGRLYLQLWNGIGATPWLREFRYPGRPLTADIAWVRYQEGAAALTH